jgi:5-methylcytosine-specific restriction endonuclease McrA
MTLIKRWFSKIWQKTLHPWPRTRLKEVLVRSLILIHQNQKKTICGNILNHVVPYCGVEINRQSRKGHLDHLIPSSEGGSNNIHNHALSCSTCNGDEKREKPWGTFLREKTNDPVLYTQRKEKIDFWLSQAPQRTLSQEVMMESEKIIHEAIENFESSVGKMRCLRDKQR